MAELFQFAMLAAVLLGLGSTVIMVWNESHKPVIGSHRQHDTHTGQRL